MFDRFIRLAKARKALAEGRCETALHLADDPWIRDDRRAEEVRAAARTALQQQVDDRIAAGDLDGAERALLRAVRVCPDPHLQSRLVLVRKEAARGQAAIATLQEHLRKAQAHAEDGDLAAAAAALAACDPGSAGAEGRVLFAAGQQRLVAQAAAAAAHLATAAEHHRAGRSQDALEALAQARKLDASLRTSAAARDVLAAGGAWLAAEVALRLGRNEPNAAVASLAAHRLAVPDLGATQAYANAVAQVEAFVLAGLRASSAPELELELLQAGRALDGLAGSSPKIAAACALLAQLVALRANGPSVPLHAALSQLVVLAHPALEAELRVVAAKLAAADQVVQAAREQVLLGNFDAARHELRALLQSMPQHEAARAELDAIERSERERAAVLASARSAADAGQLRQALALALTQAGGGAQAQEARQLAADLTARCERVQRGLDQVRAMLHSQASASAGGLQQCLSQLDELERVQADHEDVPLLRAALAAELRALEQCLSAGSQLPRQPAAAAHALQALVAERVHFVRPERLDAKLLQLADGVAAAAAALVQSGRLAAALPLLRSLRTAAVLRADLATGADRLEHEVGERQAKAAAAVAAARRALQQRDLAAAASHADEAVAWSADQGEAATVQREVQRLTAQASSLDRISALTDDGRVADAQEQLQELPPTPPFLRTRIFDMKQSLAKAQGFASAFLLRVDEGGEHLVLRSESIVIGNVRDGSADLPVLAAIAGKHARLQRTMSFHGGLADTLVAEAGPVQVNGKAVASQTLRHGDRVHLGALAVRYAMPSSRSLTASLALLGGFQAAGTDRVLLLKDRGRDGRILIGAGGDVHIAVPHATAEVEVFAHKSGQIRVRCEQGGTIDGKPFADEHPVDPGALVQAGNVTLVLLPWHAGR